VPLSVFDPRTPHPIYELVIGDRLMSIAIDPAGRRAHVVNEVPGRGAPRGALAIVDLTGPCPRRKDQFVLSANIEDLEMARDASPQAVVVSPDGATVYVSHRAVASPTTGQVTVFDALNKRIVKHIPVGSFSQGMPLTPDGCSDTATHPRDGHSPRSRRGARTPAARRSPSGELDSWLLLIRDRLEGLLRRGGKVRLR
jgi:DNA-binding beta-propeller fold protein YncE